MKKKFKCEIDCANCAAKVEAAIKKVDGVIDAKVNFLTQKRRLKRTLKWRSDVSAVMTGKT